MAMLVYMVVPLTTGCEVLVVINPAGPVHSVFIVTGTSTAGLSSSCTVQDRVTGDPTGRMGLGTLLDRITEVGAAGTVCW